MEASLSSCGENTTLSCSQMMLALFTFVFFCEVTSSIIVKITSEPSSALLTDRAGVDSGCCDFVVGTCPRGLKVVLSRAPTVILCVEIAPSVLMMK